MPQVEPAGENLRSPTRRRAFRAGAIVCAICHGRRSIRNVDDALLYTMTNAEFRRLARLVKSAIDLEVDSASAVAPVGTEFPEQVVLHAAWNKPARRPSRRLAKYKGRMKEMKYQDTMTPTLRLDTLTPTLRLASLVLAAIGFMFILSVTAQAATFQVTTTADNGDNNNPTAGSLRKAILDANGNPGPDVIDFQIPGGGVQTISPPSPLPTITDSVTIDGYTQPGASKNTLANGNNAVLLIELDGTNAGSSFSGIGLDLVKGSTTLRGLIINRFSYQGIAIYGLFGGSSGNTIEGCFIGTDPTGSIALPNLITGIYINTSNNNFIGGTAPEARNVISANGDSNGNGSGIMLAGNTGDPVSATVIQGNYIGTNAAGTAAVGKQGVGVVLSETSNTTVGGSVAEARNIISGNARGIDAAGANQSLVQGNYIGTDVSGTVAIGNKYAGIRLFDSANNIVGGSVAGARNVISGTQAGPGIGFMFIGSTGNVFQGNYIGVDVSGNNALANDNGIAILYSGGGAPSNNKIGGAGAGEGNVISGNKYYGVNLSNGSSGNTIQGNLIGTNAAGIAAIPNGDPVNKTGGGISLYTGSGDLIGGPVSGARNIISGNNGYGVKIAGGSTSELIQGNFIGVDVNGAALGNGNVGVYVDGGQNNGIGGSVAGAGNIIAFNALGGVVIHSVTDVGNAISDNAIYSNVGNQGLGLGIDLGFNGVTKNDAADSDTGPNTLQNFPVLTSATTSGGNTTIQGTLDSTANTQIRVEFFANLAFDPSFYGEGQFFLGATNVVTDAAGIATINTSFPGVPAGQFISATATDASGNTSEFSACVQLDTTPGLSINDVSITEGNSGTKNAKFTVTLTGLNGAPVTVSYATADGTAQAPGDYFIATGTLTFVPGQTTNTISVAVNGDTISEPDETFFVNLSSPTNATIARAQGLGTILNDDQPNSTQLQFNSATYSVNEGGGTATISLTRTGGSTGAVSVQYATSNGSATAGQDYTATSGTLTWADGDSSPRSFTVPITDDTLNEANETVNVALSNPGGGATLGSPSTAVLTIVDDDPAPSLSINDVSQAEGNSSTTTFSFSVTLSAASGQPVTADYATVAGTATLGNDFQPASGTLTFVPGETQKPITVLVNGDTQDEPDETFFVNLSAPSNATLLKAQGTGTIINDDAPGAPTIQFSSALYAVQEDLTAATITVARTGDTSATATVDYATSDGTASQKGDYEIASGTLTFSPGESSKTFQVLINEDSYVEGVEFLNLTLSNPNGASLGAQGTAGLNINDDVPESVTNPNDDAQNFVYQQYHDFLNREPDAGGLAYWTGQITQCGNDQNCINVKRKDLSAAFFIELEFQETGYFVYRMQKASFGTQPTYLQFMADRGRIQAGPQLEQSKQAFADAFVQRAEFKAAYPDAMPADQFINKLYDTAGLMGYANERAQAMQDLIANTKTRARVLRDVIETAEFKTNEYNPSFVLMQYFGYLRRDPDLGGYQFWLNILNTKLPNDASGYHAMVCAFITSGEYQDRFSALHTHSDGECGP